MLFVPYKEDLFVGSFHVVKAMEDISALFKNKLNNLLEYLHERVSDAAELEDKTFADLTDVKETVEHMTDEVDRVTNEQV